LYIITILIMLRVCICILFVVINTIWRPQCLKLIKFYSWNFRSVRALQLLAHLVRVDAFQYKGTNQQCLSTCSIRIIIAWNRTLTKWTMVGWEVCRQIEGAQPSMKTRNMKKICLRTRISQYVSGTSIDKEKSID
jgi:hypothetical protein